MEEDLRPIFLTSQVAKIMDGFSLEALMSEVEGKLDTKPFAVPGKSTTQALVYLLHLIHSSLDKGHCAVRLFFADFKKGFDLVDHNIIVVELQKLGVHPVLVKWTKSFLTEREQCVRIEKCFSSWKKVNGGLPQGTKLGPLLFAVLVNSLLSNWQGRIKFVDDASVLEVIPRGSSNLLPLVVNEVNNFAIDRGMILNPKKCKEMRISFLKYCVFNFDTIFVSGMAVEEVSSFKLLGVKLSDNLTWNSHIEYGN